MPMGVHHHQLHVLSGSISRLHALLKRVTPGLRLILMNARILLSALSLLNALSLLSKPNNTSFYLCTEGLVIRE